MTSTRRDRWAKGTTCCRSPQWRHWKVMKLKSLKYHGWGRRRRVGILNQSTIGSLIYSILLRNTAANSLVGLERISQYPGIVIFVKDLGAVRPRAVRQGLFVERTLLDGALPGILVGWVELSPDEYPQGQQGSGEYTQIGALLQRSRDLANWFTITLIFSLLQI